MSSELIPKSSSGAPVAPSYTFEQIKQMAVTFAKSGLYGIKDENQAFALMMECAAQGKHPGLVMRDYDMIGNRLAKKTVAMLRDFQASGGRVEWQELTDSRAAAYFSHPMAPKPILIDWDMERAKKAGLLGKTGDMYGKYARAMLRSRCISEGIRSSAPDATENMYTPDEIRAIENEEPPKIVSENTAVAEAVAATESEMPRDEVDALINSMDVQTLAELSKAFEAAWKQTKGNAAARARLKAAYDAAKAGLESQP